MPPLPSAPSSLDPPSSSRASSLPSSLGIGIGFRPEIAADLFANPRAVDFIEVVAETCFANPHARREAKAIACLWPVVPHGVKLSLGSADGIDLDRARRLGSLAREVGAPVITEHVAFVRAAGHEIGHLTQLPLTLEAVRIVARNVTSAKRFLPDVPLLLENAAWTFRWPHDDLSEGSFYTEIVEQTGCNLLLDVANLYANAINAGVDPLALAKTYPLERASMIHVAGGIFEHGFYYDTHAHPIPEPVFDLLAHVLQRTGPVPVVLEHDSDFPPFDELHTALLRAKALVQASNPKAFQPPPPSLQSQASSRLQSQAASLLQQQLAQMLTSPEPPPTSHPFAMDDILRTRQILCRKRVDDALPLLPRLASHHQTLKPLAHKCIAEHERAPRLAAIVDAMRIALAAADDAALAPMASVDLLTLQARFVGSPKSGTLRPRRGPFVQRIRLCPDRVLWAIKGIGQQALVRLIETRG